MCKEERHKLTVESLAEAAREIIDFMNDHDLYAYMDYWDEDPPDTDSNANSEDEWAYEQWRDSTINTIHKKLRQKLRAVLREYEMDRYRIA